MDDHTTNRALSVLGSATFTEARDRATQVLANALRCPRCQKLLGHVFDNLGSTLFLDDDPVALACAFDPGERDPFAARVLAACIVLSGRARVLAVPA